MKRSYCWVFIEQVTKYPTEVEYEVEKVIVLVLQSIKEKNISKKWAFELSNIYFMNGNKFLVLILTFDYEKLCYVQRNAAAHAFQV